MFHFVSLLLSSSWKRKLRDFLIARNWKHRPRKWGRCPEFGTFDLWGSGNKCPHTIGYSYHLREGHLQAFNPTCGGRAEGQAVQETQLQNGLPGSYQGHPMTRPILGEMRQLKIAYGPHSKAPKHHHLFPVWNGHSNSREMPPPLFFTQTHSKFQDELVKIPRVWRLKSPTLVS